MGSPFGALGRAYLFPWEKGYGGQMESQRFWVSNNDPDNPGAGHYETRKVMGQQPDPNFVRILSQLSANLNPQKQRRVAKRGFSQAAGELSRGTESALQGLNQSLAQRGIANSGYAANVEGALRAREGLGRASLREEYLNRKDQAQAAAQQDYMNFLNAIFGLRSGAERQYLSAKYQKAAQPSELQKVTGDIGSILGVLGPLLGGITGIGGIGGGGRSNYEAGRGYYGPWPDANAY